MYLKNYHIHLVGIGGIGMSGIASLLMDLGYRVSGSDAKASDMTEALTRQGATVHIGHRADQINGADVVVVSSAIDGLNPEVVSARKAAVPVIPRAEMLAELMRYKYGVAVAGSHGKTTTTALVAAVLTGGGLDPTVVIGGKLDANGANAISGKGDFMVVEADESDGSFLRLSPAISVVTNMDREHMDFYPDMTAVQQGFLDFIDRIPFYGLAVLCMDNPALRDLFPRIKKRMTTYGQHEQADLMMRDIRVGVMKSDFTVVYGKTQLGRFHLPLSGLHNAQNALAAIAVGLELGISVGAMKTALAHVKGVERRMEAKGECGGICVVDDYGHHPTEIQATLAAARINWPDRRLVVVFQPHRYSRTRSLIHEFGSSFENADVLMILPIYGAGEKPLSDVSGQSVVEAVQVTGHPNVMFVETAEACVTHLLEIVSAGDIVLTLGAGNVYQIGELILEKLKKCESPLP
ncbi:UDP-N-acetylmuramate--L-alanine ligase [Desulfosarcina sp. OttesenSCG-928-A07]|nr:UDP-N-acetylmuramate--L-alanine ligase [Desulfosarcina sp. OttesenSCG-928-A07]